MRNILCSPSPVLSEKEITIDFRQVIISLSDALDLVGIDEVQHGKRVAFMAVQCGKVLGYPEATLRYLGDAALLHDIGVSSSEVHQQLLLNFDWSHADVHCQVGYRLLQRVPSFAHLAEAVRYHHTRWSKLTELNLPPLTAEITNLIFLLDRVDTLAAPYLLHGGLLDNFESIRQHIDTTRGQFFASHLVDAFLTASSSFAFWIALEARYIQNFVHELAFQRSPYPLSMAELRSIAEIFARIVDAKSHFTVEHSQNVAAVAEYLAREMAFSELEIQKIAIAGLLHDIGKLRIPDAILDKAGPLTHAERTQIAMHSFETYEILRRIHGIEDIALWAAYHHEKLNGHGYPFNPSSRQIGCETRILSVADIFQALSQNRPYRGRLSMEAVAEIVQKMTDQGELDKAIVAILFGHLDECYQLAIRQTDSPLAAVAAVVGA